MPRIASESERGNRVAKAVWKWLQEQKQIKYVPWVLDPSSPQFNQQSLDRQQVKDELLTELEYVIMMASQTEGEA